MAIEAVIFDFGGVILNPTSVRDKAHLDGWARRLGLTRSALTDALWGQNWRELECGQIDDEVYHRRLGAALGLPDVQAVRRFQTEFYADEQLFPGMLDLIARLRQAGCQVALLTNAFVGLDQVALRKWGLDLQVAFDVYVNSALVKLAKPDPAIYQLALQRLGVPPEQAIFIDDNLLNVQAAAQLGIHAIHMDSPEALDAVISQVEQLVLL
jgi:putative hydrolase of the HAD superfamily